MTIKFRPHHFLCALCFRGKGYSPGFIQNFSQIMDMLNAQEGDEVEIEIVKHTDSICAPCPHRRGQSCEAENEILKLDQGHADVLGLNDLQSISWGEAKQRIRERMNLSAFHQVCDSCEWKKLGICESVLTAHRL